MYNIDNNLIIGIIDSGLDISIFNSDKHNIIYSGRIIEYNNKFSIDKEDCFDEIGHGTAIYSIIKKKLKNIDNVKYVIIKVFDNNLLTNVQCLIYAINKCIEKKCDIINISAVITNNNLDLEKVCKKAYDENIKIIAAESNFPTKLAFPARYRTCYGVQSGKCYGANDYYFNKSAKSQFIARGDEQRVKWLNNTQIFIGGASFAAAHITAYISNILLDNKHISRDDFERQLINGSLLLSPNLVSLSNNAKLNLFIDSVKMQREAKKFLNWNINKNTYKLPIILTNKEYVSKKKYLSTNEIIQVLDEKYDLVIVSRNFFIKDYEAFEKKLIAHNKYIYYLFSDYMRISKRKNLSTNINDYIFDSDMILKNDLIIEKHLTNYIVKAPLMGIISSDFSNELWNKAYTIKSLFIKEGYKAVIFDATSYTNMFGAEASCCCTDEKALITDYSNYKRILSLFIKCLDYHYCPDIILIIGRLSLTKNTIINDNYNSIVQSCAFIFSCLIEAFVVYKENSYIDEEYIDNLEFLSKGKFIGYLEDTNMNDIYKQIKKYFS